MKLVPKLLLKTYVTTPRLKHVNRYYIAIKGMILYKVSRSFFL